MAIDEKRIEPDTRRGSLGSKVEAPSALRATSALLAGLPRAENLRQRLAVVACVGGGGLTAGVWLSRLALARVAQILVDPGATP